MPDGETIDGDNCGDDRQQLVRDFSNLLTAVGGMEYPREQALAYCVSAIRSQFYGDGNKRTARAMTIGHLMSNGYAAISVPYSRLLEYNAALEDLFKTDHATDLMQFLATCSG